MSSPSVLHMHFWAKVTGLKTVIMGLLVGVFKSCGSLHMYNEHFDMMPFRVA